MRILKPNLLLGMRVVLCALAFFLTILIGAFLDADPKALLFAPILVYILFYILLTHVVTPVVDRVHSESVYFPKSPEDEKMKRGKSAGQFLDLSQGAEMPF